MLRGTGIGRLPILGGCGSMPVDLEIAIPPVGPPMPFVFRHAHDVLLAKLVTRPERSRTVRETSSFVRRSR